MKSKKTQKGVQSVHRAVSLLKLIAASNPTGMRLTDLARQSALELSTVHRLLSTLIDEGLVQQRPSDRHYVVGPFCEQLGRLLTAPVDIRAWSQNLLVNVAMETGDATFLVVPSGFDTLCVNRAVGTYPIQTLAIDIGHRQPIGIGSGGLAILGEMPEPKVKQLIAANEWRLHHYGGISAARLLHLVQKTRQRGYAVIGNHAVPGVIGVGVVMRDSQQQVFAGLSVASIEERMTNARQEELANFMKEKAQQYLKKNAISLTALET